MRATLLFALVLALLALAGCVSPGPSTQNDPSPPAGPTPTTDLSSCKPTQPTSSVDIAPTRAESVSNHPGAFSYSGSPAAKTAVDEYAWQDASGSAHLAWSGSAATGTMRVRILDACSHQEYDSTNAFGSGSSSQSLPARRPGDWLIHLEFTAFTGSVSFSLNG